MYLLCDYLTINKVYIKSMSDTLSLHANQRYCSFFVLYMLFLFLLLILLIGIFVLVVHKDNGVSLNNIKSSLYFNSHYVIRPHRFATEPLQSDTSIFDIVGQINTFMPQLADFINQFTTTIDQTGVRVFTDHEGNMSVSVPASMSDEVANTISKKIGIIDRLINTRGQEIDDLLRKGVSIENKLKMENPNYVSQLTAKIEELKRLKSSYKH